MLTSAKNSNTSIFLTSVIGVLVLVLTVVSKPTQKRDCFNSVVSSASSFGASPSFIPAGFPPKYPGNLAASLPDNACTIAGTT